jgi:hypothetical protein
MIDWDLEAPGLHRFFAGQITDGDHSPPQLDQMEDSVAGLLDLFTEVYSQCGARNGGQRRVLSEDEVRDIVTSIPIERYILRTSVPSLHLIKAGAFDASYATRVATFPWADLFAAAPGLFQAFAARLSEDYRYVLIDSRTGYTDTSGICTMAMPQKLVIVFTPNRQSLDGIKMLVERALQYRGESADQRPLLVYPLPSRIENNEQELRRKWRLEPEGYQPLFERLFTTVYKLPQCRLDQYFDDVQIQHVPRYAYGEQIAALIEPQPDRLSLTVAYKTFTKYLVEVPVPWHIDEAVPEVPKSEQELRQQRLEQDLMEGRAVQKALLPKRIPEIPNFEITCYWQPARDIGGDYYDLIPLRDGTIGLCIADVVGKGLPAALLLSMVVSEVRNIASETASPAELCKKVSTRILHNIGDAKYATLFYGILDSRTRRLTYTNAGHNHPVLLPRRDDPVRLEGGGFPLGLFEQAAYGEFVVHLAPGYRLMMFTDGVTELENSDGEEFGDERLLDLLISNRDAPTADLMKIVVNTLNAFGNGKFQDDVTLVLLSAM